MGRCQTNPFAQYRLTTLAFMEKNKNANANKMNTPKFNLNWLYLTIIIALMMLWFASPGGNISKSISYTEFKDYVEKGYANKIISYDDNSAELYIKPEFAKNVFGNFMT